MCVGEHTQIGGNKMEVMDMDEYQQLKQEMPEECLHYEQTKCASRELLTKAKGLSIYLGDKMLLDTLTNVIHTTHKKIV